MASIEYDSAAAPAPDEGGFFRRTLKTLGIMGSKGASWGLKTAGYTALGGLGLMALGGLAIWGATAIGFATLGMGLVAATTLLVGGATALGGLGLIANAIPFGLMGGAAGAVLAPSMAPNTNVAAAKEFSGPQVSVQQQIQQERARGTNLTAYYTDLQRNTVANQQALDEQNAMAFSAPSAEPIPGHAAKVMAERAAQANAAADPTLAGSAR